MSNNEIEIRARGQVAEQTVADLERKRSAAAARAEAIAEPRKRLGFAVHASGDKEARQQLDKFNAEDAALAGESSEPRRRAGRSQSPPRRSETSASPRACAAPRSPSARR